MVLVKAAEVAAPSTVNGAVPPALDAICLRALARDPAARYPSGDALADALEPLVDGWSAARVQALVAELFPEDALAGSEPAPATATTAITETGEEAQPARPRRRRALIGLVALAATAAAAALALVARAPSTRPAPAPTVAATAAPASAPSPAPAPPPRVTIELRSEPPAASVFLDGDATARGLTPLQLELPASARPLRLELRKPSFMPEAMTVIPDVARAVQVRLRPTPAPSPPVRPGKRAHRDPSKPKAFDPDAALPL
jgi:serine/threonine-protein kinase